MGEGRTFGEHEHQESEGNTLVLAVGDGEELGWAGGVSPQQHGELITGGRGVAGANDDPNQWLRKE